MRVAPLLRISIRMRSPRRAPISAASSVTGGVQAVQWSLPG